MNTITTNATELPLQPGLDTEYFDLKNSQTQRIQVLRLIQGAKDYRIYISSTGIAAALGGVITSQPGSSSVFLGAEVPYHRSLLASTTRQEAVQKAVSEDTAIRMANESYLRGLEAIVRAGELADGKPLVIGLGITGAVASGQRRGTDRMFSAVRTRDAFYVLGIEFEKGSSEQDRQCQSELAEKTALNILLAACGLRQEEFNDSKTNAVKGTLSNGIVGLSKVNPPELVGDGPYLIQADGTCGDMSEISPETHIIFPGSFRAFHCGHDYIARAAEELTGKKVVFEITSNNPGRHATSDYNVLAERSVQFRGRWPVILRNDAGLFSEKAAAYGKGTSFITGYDTAERILNKEYYNNSLAELETALEELSILDANFYVLGRSCDKGFKTADDLWVPVKHRHMFHNLHGKLDISSSQLLG